MTVKFVVLRLKRVRHPDVVCIERIEHFLREETERGVTVLLAGVRPDMLGVLNNVGSKLVSRRAYLPRRRR